MTMSEQTTDSDQQKNTADQQSQPQKNDLTNVGFFWKKDKNGRKFYSGDITVHGKRYTAFLFSNIKDKDKPNQCDVRLVLVDYDKSLMVVDNENTPISEDDGGLF